LEYDVWYVDHQSFSLDLKILLITIFRVLTGSGVKLGQDVAEVDDLGLSKSYR
jgi:lipopolysaccharide/colanic/teichoic acid biosynthesis glycosyltransferase